MKALYLFGRGVLMVIKTYAPKKGKKLEMRNFIGP